MFLNRLPRMGPTERRVAEMARRLRIEWEASVAGSATVEIDEDSPLARKQPHGPPSALFVAGTLALARLVDGTPGFKEDWRAGHPILVDVSDRSLFEEIRCSWRGVLDVPAGQVLYLDKAHYGDRRSQYVATALFTSEQPKNRPTSSRELLEALGWGLPCLGVSPSARSCMPTSLLDAARHKLALSGLDPVIVTRTITLVTGQRCRPGRLLAAVRFPVSSEHLAVAVRHGRSPAACIAEIARLQKDTGADRSRALTLGQLHGLDPAVAWARATISDLQAWRNNRLGWDAIDHGVVLNGPPGTGKTLFAKVFSQESGLPLVAGSLAKWQSRGHLGDTLKAMRADFAKAANLAPCILFTDEVDSFGDRSKFDSYHADYSTQVVNCYIECLDGIDGRSGLIFIAASNDATRCDPAILRSGRLNRIIEIALPDERAREAMLRVRLGDDLVHADLGDIAASSDGFSGADIEKLVKDARRIARQERRQLVERDLHSALDRDERARSPALRQRIAVHEAGHALAAVLHRGPDDVRVTIRGRGATLGSVSVRKPEMIGTREDLEEHLVWTLAGRAAEEIVLGSPSAGAGAVRGSDLHQATLVAAAMVGALGIAGPHPHLFVAEADDTAEILSYPGLRDATDEILRKAYGTALGLMRAHRPALRRITAELLERRRLRGDDIARILVDVEGLGVRRPA